ncbi:putative LIM zinc-binding domain-containing protein [Seiridium cardinale]|uniref:LIM zinc-binding domain-containing protein n=1 Tax=Seiridium cardinale TaxID=138064 RepID=A0ABR2XAH9_9PEZI
MLGSLRGKSKERPSTPKATPSEPSYMDSKQFATYLAGLRETRVNRPGGARPPPSSASTTRRDSDHIAPGRPSIGGASLNTEASSAAPSHMRAHSDFARPQSIRPSLVGSVASRYSTMSGRDYYPEKTSPTKPLRPDEVVPTATYMERGSRWMEKEEAVSLRTALEDMDIKDEQKKAHESSDNDDGETRLYNAALDEAAELVWQHQHGIKPPEAGTPYRYKSHLRENSYAHARTASTGKFGSDVVPTGLARDGARSVSGSSSGSDGRASLESPRMSMDGQRKTSVDSGPSKPYGSLAKQPSTGARRRSSMKRNISGGIEKPFSGDQIWEEPEVDVPKESTSKLVAKPAEEITQPLRLRLRNPLNKVQFAPESAPSEEDKASPVTSPVKPLQRVEIHRNPPTQSRNPNYTANSPKPAGPRANESVPKKNGVEIRGDDIRQATSFKLGDRSRKLPTPSAVSDRPGRPIVSFDANWKPPEEAAADKKPEPKKEPSRFSVGVRQDQQERADSKHQPQSNTQTPTHPPIPTISFTPDIQTPAEASRPTSSTPSIPSISVDAPSETRTRPSVPTIAVTRDDSPTLPSITISGDDDSTPSIPIIVTPDDDYGSKSSPSIPTIVVPGDGDNTSTSNGVKPPARPLPTPTRRNPFMRNNRGSQGHWSAAPGSTSSRATAICHECSSPIEGRFVSLRGGPERFHPQCFACYTCGTSLEALEISPEPDSFRSARLDRIARRAAGEILPEEPGQTMAEDGDARLRFFCHLDWHELFAPRCKTCTTPILGEHIVALGHHFHYGHFFCAECGDPFERGMTHIEKDGYAWCVKCQTKRTERRAPKCKRCKLPVIGQYVQALGGEWHDECFRCGTCGGGFDDGQIFPVTDGIRCTDCRMRELKA